MHGNPGSTNHELSGKPKRWYTYVKYSARRQVRPSTCTTRVVHIILSLLEKERSEVVCQVLSLLSQWLYGNTFRCTHRHKSAASTTIKHPHTPNGSKNVTAINGTEPSRDLQILLYPKPVDKCNTTASIMHSHSSTKHVFEYKLSFKIYIHSQNKIKKFKVFSIRALG